MLLLFLRSCMRVQRGSSSCQSWRSQCWDWGMHCRTGWTCWGCFCLHWMSWECWFRFIWELWSPCHCCCHFHILKYLLVMLSLQTLVLVQLQMLLLQVVHGSVWRWGWSEGSGLLWWCYLVFLVVDSVVCHELTNRLVAQLKLQFALARGVSLVSVPHDHVVYVRGCFVVAIEEQMCYRVQPFVGQYRLACTHVWCWAEV